MMGRGHTSSSRFLASIFRMVLYYKYRLGVEDLEIVKGSIFGWTFRLVQANEGSVLEEVVEMATVWQSQKKLLHAVSRITNSATIHWCMIYIHRIHQLINPSIPSSIP